MAIEDIRLGPFVGGLNTASDPTAIGDTELAELVNFEMDDVGALVNRPPIESVVTFSLPANGGTEILGYYFEPGGVARLIATDRVSNTYWFNGNTWTLLAARAFSAMVQYRDELWLITPSGSAQTGGKWTPSGGFVADANIPQGGAIISHKDRLWVAAGKEALTNGTRLYMSTIVSAAVSWPVSKVFINISAGDGQNIVDIMVYQSDIVIFKERSTYRFSFAADPALGTATRISATIGAANSGCVVEYQTQVFVLYNNKIFEFSSYNFQEINSQVPLRADNPSVTLWRPYGMSAWAGRIIVNYYDYTYVYSLKTRTWSTWKTKHPSLGFMGRFFEIPNGRPDQPSAYLAGVSRNMGGLFRITDAITSVAEEMDCYLVTKNYDYQSPARFKKLQYSVIDMIGNVSLDVETRPVSYTRYLTWDEAALRTWDEASEFTWDRPTDASNDVKETLLIEGAAYGRKVVKTSKALRFRQLAFKVGGKTFGDTSTAPLRIFSITTFVGDKERVVAKVS